MQRTESLAQTRRNKAPPVSPPADGAPTTISISKAINQVPRTFIEKSDTQWTVFPLTRRTPPPRLPEFPWAPPLPPTPPPPPPPPPKAVKTEAAVLLPAKRSPVTLTSASSVRAAAHRPVSGTHGQVAPVPEVPVAAVPEVPVAAVPAVPRQRHRC